VRFGGGTIHATFRGIRRLQDPACNQFVTRQWDIRNQPSFSAASHGPKAMRESKGVPVGSGALFCRLWVRKKIKVSPREREAVVVDFVCPLRPGRQDAAIDWQTRFDEAGRTAKGTRGVPTHAGIDSAGSARGTKEPARYDPANAPRWSIRSHGGTAIIKATSLGPRWAATAQTATTTPTATITTDTRNLTS
jgi:hypothetical protein